MGRIIAAILIAAGVGLFATFTAYVASYFLEPDGRQEAEVLQELKAIRQQLDERPVNKDPGSPAATADINSKSP